MKLPGPRGAGGNTRGPGFGGFTFFLGGFLAIRSTLPENRDGCLPRLAVRIIDGGTPQPPQRFGPPEFMLWVAKQITLAEKVFTCYEAGPFGYSLHRKLEKMGATNYVVRPREGALQLRVMTSPLDDFPVGAAAWLEFEPRQMALIV